MNEKEIKRKRYKKQDGFFIGSIADNWCCFYLKPFLNLSLRIRPFISTLMKKEISMILFISEESRFAFRKIFNMLAKRMNYLSNIKTGCYAVKNGMTMIELIRICVQECKPQ